MSKTVNLVVDHKITSVTNPLIKKTVLFFENNVQIMLQMSSLYLKSLLQLPSITVISCPSIINCIPKELWLSKPPKLSLFWFNSKMARLIHIPFNLQLQRVVVSFWFILPVFKKKKGFRTKSFVSLLKPNNCYIFCSKSGKLTIPLKPFIIKALC